MSTQTPMTTVETVAEDRRTAARRGRRVHPTVAYVGRRVALYLVSLWGALSASFIFFRLIPGNPMQAIIGQLQAKGQYSDPGQSAALVDHYQKSFGLDGSLLQQYWRYTQQVILHQDFGPAILSYPTPATHIVMRGLPWTMGLIGSATLLGWVVGLAGGTFVGWARGTRAASWLTNFSLLISHVPAFFIALGLVYVFAYRRPLLPANSAYDARLTPGWHLDFIMSVIKHGALPVIATALVGAANWLIGTRALVVSILGEDYLTYAAAKGLGPRRILASYVMRNAWLPQIAALGIVMGSVINGNVLIERLFRYPGLGNLLVDAIEVKDVNTAQAIVALLIFLVLTLNLIIDLALPLLDPRVKRGQ